MAVYTYTHELTELGRDFDRAADTIAEKVYDVTRGSIRDIVDDAQRRVRGHAHLPHLPRSFTYDVGRRGHHIEAEAGGDWSRLQGRLDVFIEYGTPTSRGIRHWLPASETEVPQWIERLELACTEEVERRR